MNIRIWRNLFLLPFLLIFAACVMPITPPAQSNVDATGSATSQTVPAPTATPADEAPVAPSDGIVDIMWLWQNQKDSAGKTVIEVPNPESYRLMLHPDGSFSAKADCNMASGSYTLEGSALSLAPGPMTAAACAEDSLADFFLALLTQMDTAVGDGDTMRLSSRADGTNMNFTKFYAVTGRILGPAGAQLPQPAEVEVRVDDVSKADAPAQQVGAQTNSTATQFPIDFEATYDPGAIDERLSYALTVRITDSKGKLHFINTQSYPVLTRGHPTYNVEVLVDPVDQ